VEITYTFTEAQVQVDQESGLINGIAVGLNGSYAQPVEGGDPIDRSGYVDGLVPMTPAGSYTADDIRTSVLAFAVANGWFNQVRQQIETAVGAPVPGSKFVI